MNDKRFTVGYWIAVVAFAVLSGTAAIAFFENADARSDASEQNTQTRDAAVSRINKLQTQLNEANARIAELERENGQLQGEDWAETGR